MQLHDVYWSEDSELIDHMKCMYPVTAAVHAVLYCIVFTQVF